MDLFRSFVVLVCLLLPAYGYPDWTGNKLITYCTQGVKFLNDEDLSDVGAMQASACMGYVTALFQKNNFDTDVYQLRQDYCIPDHVTRAQTLRVILKYLNDHPEELHAPAYVVARNSLVVSFPCP